MILSQSRANLRKGVEITPCCPCYNQKVDTVFHTLFECRRYREVWARCVPSFPLRSVPTTNFDATWEALGAGLSDDNS